MIAVLMIQISRCAVASLCPSDHDLQSAVYQRTNEELPAITNELHARNPEMMISVHASPASAIKDVRCGEAAEKSETVTCSFTVVYRRFVHFEVAKLTRQNERWTIVDMLRVERRR
jgi:hypothetical protein